MKHLIAALVLTTSVNALAQETPAQASVSQDSHQDLRKRTHGMTWEMTSSNTKLKNKDTNTESETTSTESKFGYLYNFGRFELGGAFTSSTDKNEDTGDKTTAGTFELIGHINILKNEPGEDLVPYAALSLGSVVMESDTLDAKGSTASLGFGLKWFPLSEIFALKAELGAGSASIKDDNTDIELEVKATYFNIGWAFYF
ncbi:hypothetical protein [Bdellovibrio bacteriovorus]|uniref:Outer membrane protein beta-barrel domain-containing protein n=1 Tax=Bdellovibrio bacteriovorus str. Tiberius TaxID=1069642 RepID=K7Z9S5_BDEBC|nr:hypothetical protein [Bdellovibrio bacteriovorus]AFY01324.1 hypothetical protein Bdt_1629 [Bdellovibrio bacteriovorus str. Tiberius]